MNPLNKNGMRSFKSMIEENTVVKCVDQACVEICKRCGGIGSYLEEEYSGRDMSLVRHACKVCDSDGRVVIVRRIIKIDSKGDQCKEIPLSKFTDKPFYNNTSWIKIIVDRRDEKLEEKHPSLKALSYSRYHAALDKYETLDRIQNPKKWTKNE
jgi:hypothetical protein